MMEHSAWSVDGSGVVKMWGSLVALGVKAAIAAKKGVDRRADQQRQQTAGTGCLGR